MIKGKFIGKEPTVYFDYGSIYDILSVEFVGKLPTLEVYDEMHDTGFWPYDMFEIVEGKEEFEEILSKHVLVP